MRYLGLRSDFAGCAVALDESATGHVTDDQGTLRLMRQTLFYEECCLRVVRCSEQHLQGVKALATKAASCALEAAQGSGRWAQSLELSATVATRPWAIVSDWKRYQISRRLLVVLVKQFAVPQWDLSAARVGS